MRIVLATLGAAALGLSCCQQLSGAAPRFAAAVEPVRWVDLREANMARWKDRFDRIRAETDGIPAADSSSRYLRDRQFWGEEGRIQPGKVVGWVFATEEKGARMK